MNKNTAIGYLELTSAQLIIGANVVIAKSLLDHVSLCVLLFLRFFLGTLLLSSVSFARHKKLNLFVDKQGKPFSLKDGFVLFLQAACGGFLFNVLMFTGLRFTDATAAGVISSTTPAVIVIFSFLFLKERIGIKRAISIILAICGLMTLSLGKGGGIDVSYKSLYGDFFVLLAVFPEALFTILAKWHGSNISSMTMSLFVNAANLLLFIPCALYVFLTSSIVLTPHDWMLIAIYGLSGGTLFYVFWYRGLEKCSASIAALFACVMPVSTTILAYFFLGERMTTHEFFAILFIVFSIAFGSFSFKNLKKIKFMLNG